MECFVTNGRTDWLTQQLAQALPPSLRGLEAFSVPVKVLARLTALERLSLHEMRGCSQTTVGLSALQRLTHLRLREPEIADLQAIASCTNLRTLRIGRKSLLKPQVCAA
jgi:hypothetical protein